MPRDPLIVCSAFIVCACGVERAGREQGPSGGRRLAEETGGGRRKDKGNVGKRKRKEVFGERQKEGRGERDGVDFDFTFHLAHAH